jgi:hypothetical protein
MGKNQVTKAALWMITLAQSVPPVENTDCLKLVYFKLQEQSFGFIYGI